MNDQDVDERADREGVQLWSLAKATPAAINTPSAVWVIKAALLPNIDTDHQP